MIQPLVMIIPHQSGHPKGCEVSNIIISTAVTGQRQGRGRVDMLQVNARVWNGHTKTCPRWRPTCSLNIVTWKAWLHPTACYSRWQVIQQFCQYISTSLLTGWYQIRGYDQFQTCADHTNHISEAWHDWTSTEWTFHYIIQYWVNRSRFPPSTIRTNHYVPLILNHYQVS